MNRAERDKRNAQRARELAAVELEKGCGAETNARFARMARESIEAVQRTGFQAMVEVEVELANGKVENQLWYANDGVSVNSPLADGGNDSRLNVLAWTHAGLQAALTEDLGDYVEPFGRGYQIVVLSPKARARFRRVVPDIVGLYEPGGAVGEAKPTAQPRAVGLKAVRLDMTKDQARAFRSAMSGMLMVSGAPGSGKTTVAFQRIRFLIDQQEHVGERQGVVYELDNTRIFLANRNLIQFSKGFLERELNIPQSSVDQVGDLITQYLEAVWKWKRDAQLRRRALAPVEQKARDAMFGLSGEEELRACWKSYEKQITKRLAESEASEWKTLASKKGVTTSRLIGALRDASKAGSPGTAKASISPWRMDVIYQYARVPYEAARGAFGSAGEREKFDEAFAQWLFKVYDPLDALEDYFGGSRYAAGVRIRKGTNGRANQAKVIDAILEDWSKHLYGEEEQAWIAYLLRFALPETGDTERRFRIVPHALTSIGAPWSHIVIDEAQDLSAAEAAFLSSLVHKSGAMTVSADFHQRVSATHGMDDAEAIKLGLPFVNAEARTPYRFSENKRQTAEITRFLRGYYETTFGEVPPFDVAKDAPHGPKPELLLGDDTALRARLRSLKNILGKSGQVGSVAVLLVEEDDANLAKLKSTLKAEGISSNGPQPGRPEGWTVAYVEQIKGLEYETCVILGLDDVDPARRDYGRNRAYVALSRPARRLLMFCRDYPRLLRKIPAELFEKVDQR
jgi:hypothetical protein